MYSDNTTSGSKSRNSGLNSRLGGMVRDAAKQAAQSARTGNVSSRLGPSVPKQTVKFNKNSLYY